MMTTDAYTVLLAARPGDRFLRHDVVPARVERSLAHEGAVAWTSHHPLRGVRWLTVLGAGPDLAAAADELAARVRADGEVVSGVTSPTAAWADLPDTLRPPSPEHWCWWWTDRPPAPRPGEGLTRDLSPDDVRIAPLLAHSASASARPGDPRVRRWLGVLDGSELLSCAALTEHVPGVPHLASVVTRPDARGRGLAADICARLARDALAEGAEVVTLGMYSGNDTARRLYTGLGFRVEQEFASGYLAGHEPADGTNDPDVAPADGGGTA